VTDLKKLREALNVDDMIHIDDLEEGFDCDRYPKKFLKKTDPIPVPMTCVYCNAPWTPEMVELVELSGYCSTCADAERVIDVFCSACTRLVYRKEVE
jgi:hypothetical protein